ncbi:MAG: hypothetical protein NZ651_06240 [Candidatus Bipolaricaulota bacterium]|nr:hypothetical protein [Candidatus Bipolaricaulota bacterium]MDW8127353.1 hypothetical protein [Candidatus Bipolaricaulota bacterium]
MSQREALIVALADLHCGHFGAITPPDYWYPLDSGDAKIKQIAQAQREMYEAYMEDVREFQKPDVLVVNGDLIEGTGRLTGGTELLTTDVETQCRIAAQLLALWEAKKIILTYGTSYHTTIDGQDADRFVATLLAKDGYDVEIHSHAFVKVNGCVFDVRHYAGRSNLPHTKGTPLGREWFVNLLWAARDEQPQANVILRAHIHSFFVAGGADPDWLAFFQPCWLAAMTKYGARRCSGTVDVGTLIFGVSANGRVSWDVRLKKLMANRREPIEVKV